ncbi:MAG TPA: tRNA 2-selenouridine(34) synthase MnmH [Panacibacter sp.]|nr:tRNA 2-selenouridine(34) synthase MnmH [Panacibacter sp.]HNP46353.1 tRNA 2-selenouridine(34) synthase MnmH [Panacibacter sp.]
MAIEKLFVPTFIELSKIYPVLDVRSPGEFSHAHIPGAYSLPLFTDEERKVVGTAYKQQGKQQAIKIGLKYFGVQMAGMIEQVEAIYASHTKGQPVDVVQRKTLLVHCWRGGMRSSGVAWLLDLYGFKVYILAGGYKFFRRWVFYQFEKEYTINVIGGYTGSGKTDVLQQLQQQGLCAIDLEAIAMHKGSAFGNLTMVKQPSQEMFENLLAIELDKVKSVVWIEDESQRIGDINLPMAFYLQKQKSPVYNLNVPFEERLTYIVEHYGRFEKEKLINAVIRIKKRLGGLETKTAINFLLEDDIKSAFAVLLKYYDKWYLKCIDQKANPASLTKPVECTTVDAVANANAIIKTAEK